MRWNEALKRFAWRVDRLEMCAIRMALARCRTDLPYEHECTAAQRAAATAFVKALLDRTHLKGDRKQRTSSESNVRLLIDAFIRLEPSYGRPGEFYDPRELELYKNGAKICGAEAEHAVRALDAGCGVGGRRRARRQVVAAEGAEAAADLPEAGGAAGRRRGR